LTALKVIIMHLTRFPR